MKFKSSIIGYFVLFSFLLTICILKAENEPAEIDGIVYVNGSLTFSMKVSYSETNGIGEKTTRYFEKSGQLRLEENEVFNTNSLDLIRFNLKDFKSGRHEEYYKMQDEVVIKYKKDSRTDFKEKTKKPYRHLLHGSMIVLYIIKHMEEIEESKKISFNLLVPKYSTAYGFLLKKVRETDVNGKKCYVIKMYPSSLFLRAFVKPTYFFIERENPHRLLKYEGIITPKADNGKSFRGIASFSY